MKFGTSGLRGLSVDLKGRASALYATAFGRYLLDSGMARHGDVLLIGKDFRDSSPEIAANCADALAGLGFDILDCGTVPTPALALYGLQQKGRLPDDNGLAHSSRSQRHQSSIGRTAR